MKRETPNLAGCLPRVSIILPIRNEAGFIERCLTALFRQTYPNELIEIVVAEGMSTDNTREIVEGIGAKARFPMSIVDNPERIAATGLNRALEKSTGEIVIRVDGHCEVDDDYVENCVDLLRSGLADGVGGPIQTIGDGWRAKAIALAMGSPFGVGGSAFRTIANREMYTDTVAFPGYTREILKKAGPFDEELVRNQDDEYNYRIRELGGRILLSPRIRSRYYSRSTFRKLMRQYFEYGYWKVRVLQLHPKQMSARQFVPFIFVMSVMTVGILSAVSVTGKWLLVALTGSYLLTNLGSSIYTSRGRIALIPLLSVSYFILHLSYGLGSLVGLVAFRSRWKDSGANHENARYGGHLERT